MKTTKALRTASKNSASYQSKQKTGNQKFNKNILTCILSHFTDDHQIYLTLSLNSPLSSKISTIRIDISGLDAALHLTSEKYLNQLNELPASSTIANVTLPIPPPIFDGETHTLGITLTFDRFPSVSTQLTVTPPRIIAFPRESIIENPILASYTPQFKEIFLPDYYQNQATKTTNSNIIDQYFLQSSPDTIKNPHPLFDSSYYYENNPDVKNKGLNPLVHYILYGAEEGREFHPLFNTKYYTSEITRLTLNTDRTNILLHYLRNWRSLRVSPHNLFDISYYIDSREPGYKFYSDPLSDYLVRGYAQNYDFHRCISEPHIKSPHQPKTPYLLTLSKFKDFGMTAVPFFDDDHYYNENIDIREHNINPKDHFFNYGFKENHRTINKFHSKKYIHGKFSNESLYLTTENCRYLQYIKSFPTRMLFCGHDASRTGAPLILLTILKQLQERYNLDIFLILLSGGDLVDEYERYAHIVKAWEFPSHKAVCRYVLERLADNKPKHIFLNSVETRTIGRAMNDLGLFCTCLFHEIPDFYPSSVLNEVNNWAHRLIFPSDFTKSQFIKRVPRSTKISELIPQGLLESKFTRLPRYQCRAKVLEELKLPISTSIVIGCGTMDRRKGIDLFCLAAVKYARQFNKKQEVAFIWIGDGSTAYDSAAYWGIHDLKKSGTDVTVRLIGPRSDVAPYFGAADVFVLTSRADPFPCVIHEAMAAGLHVIAFDEAGGAPEALANGAGTIVPYGDLDALAAAVYRALEQGGVNSTVAQIAKNRVETHFSFDRYVDRLMEKIERPVKTITEDINGRLHGIKVYFSAPDWGISGVNTFTSYLIRALRANGVDARFIFTRGRFCDIKNDDISGIPRVFLQPIDNTPDAVWNEVSRFLESRSPCIFVPNYDYVASAATPGLSSNVGTVGILHADDVEHYEHGYRLGLYWNKIIAVSDVIRSRMIELNPALESKTIVINTGVPIPNRINNINAIDRIRLIYAGRFEIRQKRIYDYVHLAEILTRLNINFHLTLAGDGEEFSSVKDSLADFIDSGSVSLPGRLNMSEIGEMFQNADVVLLLSNFEGLPISVLEAMSHGCIPIVYNTRSGLATLVRDGKNGFLVPIGNVNMVANIVNKLHGNRKAVNKLKQSAISTVSSEFSIEMVARKYKEVFSEIADDIVSGRYQRPSALTFLSKIGKVIPPPSLW